MAVQNWIKEMTEDVLGKSKLAIGKRLPHPDGRIVEVTQGQYWGEHGLSNFWYWREVMPDGSLSKKEEHGYGW